MVFKDFYSYRRAAGTNINNFFICYEFCIRDYKNLESPCWKEFRPFFFVLNAANISEKNEKLLRIMYGSLTYIAMKDMLRKCFANILSSKYNTVLAIKEKMEMVNFNRYSNNKGQKTYQGSS